MTTASRKQHTAGKGSVIIEQGKPGDCAYLIQSGRVKISVNQLDGKTLDLAQMGPGQIFGEMALVSDEPRGATVTALEDCNLIVITRDVVEEKLKRSDPMIKALMPMMTDRLRKMNNAMLKDGGSPQDMIDVVNTIYRKIQADLSAGDKKKMDNIIAPAMDEFIKAVREYVDRTTKVS